MAVVTLAVSFLVSSCGSAAPRHAAVPVPLYQRVDRLVVRRTNAFPQNHIRFSFPARVAVRDPLAVRAVARALYALPKARSGVYFGPIDLGIVYHLTFYEGDQQVLVVSVDATGMEDVTGLVPARTVAGTSFWSTLAVAMGLPHPSQARFQGSL